jgi:hypothetical protein
VSRVVAMACPPLSPSPDLGDLRRDPNPDAQPHTAGSRTDRPPRAPEPAEEDMDFLSQKQVQAKARRREWVTVVSQG